MANVDYQRLAEEILAEAARVDAEEDELYGDARGDELPEHLRTAEGRRKALKEAKERLERRRSAEADSDAGDGDESVELEFDQELLTQRPRGGPQRVETHHRHPQPPQAPPAQDRYRSLLTADPGAFPTEL